MMTLTAFQYEEIIVALSAECSQLRSMHNSLLRDCNTQGRKMNAYRKLLDDVAENDLIIADRLDEIDTW